MNTNPQVYVGTYRKYNNGSIKGEWVDITKFDNYAQFVTACRLIHCNEEDPEFMIQDHQYLPDGLGCSEWITEQEFDDIINAWRDEQPKYQIIDYSEKAIAVVGDTREIKDQLKSLGGRFNAKLSCGAGWVFPKTKREELQALLNGEAVESAPKGDGDDFVKQCKEIFAEYLKQCRGADYDKKHHIGALKMNDGYILIPKFSIDNQFCWADEGADYDEYCEIMKDKDVKLREYFLNRNLSKVDIKLDALRTDKHAYIGKEYRNNRRYWYAECYYGDGKNNQDDIEMTMEQRELIIKAYEWARIEFEKRLNTYLNKYGVSKLNTWTYWRDA